MSDFDLREALFMDGVFIAGNGRLRGYAPPPDATGRAVHFDNDEALYRVSALTGAPDSFVGVQSVWFKTTDTSTLAFFSSTTAAASGGLPTNNGEANHFATAILSLGSQRVGGANIDGRGGNSIIKTGTTVSTQHDDEWHHLLVAWDTNFTSGNRIIQIVMDGVLEVSMLHTEAGASAFSTNWANEICLNVNSMGFTGGQPVTQEVMDMAELYVNLEEYLDLSNPANVEKFRNPENGKPRFLGLDGSVPTGTAPIIYLKVSTAGVASSFATNLGTGGDFSIFGTLSIADTDPY